MLSRLMLAASLGWATTPSPAGPVDASFTVYTAQSPAVTYDQALVPVGAHVTLTINGAGTKPRISLRLNGLKPQHAYGAHLHTGKCGPSGADAGPHYQYEPDPAATKDKPSTDPAYANPVNEIWLDFTTDATGVGTATVTHDWPFEGERKPRSLVVHSEPTQTNPGVAGMAGARAACVNLP